MGDRQEAFGLLSNKSLSKSKEKEKIYLQREKYASKSG